MSALRNAALAYTRMGLTIIPSVPRSKKPLIEWGEFRTRRPELAVVETWFDPKKILRTVDGRETRGTPDANLQVICGGATRLLVLDLDGAGAEEFLNANGVELPAFGPRVKSGRIDGGEHVWMRVPAKYAQLASKNDVFHTKKARGFAIDIKNENGLATVPPSVHENGSPYTWSSSLGEIVDIPEVPDELMALLLESPAYKDQPSDGEHGPKVSEEEIAEMLRGVSRGSRNETAARLAGWFLARGLTREQTYAALQAWRVIVDNDPSDRFTVKELWNVVKSISVKDARKREAEEREERKQRDAAFATVEVIDSDGMRRHVTAERPLVVSTPFPSLNSIINGGFRPGQYVILMAPAGAGKSALAMQFASHASFVAVREGRGAVWYISLEMSPISLAERFWSQETRVPVNAFVEGSNSLMALDAIDAQGPKLEKARKHLYVLPGVVSVMLMREALAAAEVLPSLVVVDYLQQLRGDRKIRDARERLENESALMKQTCIDFGIPTLALSSVSRPRDAASKDTPDLSQIRGSEQIRHDCDFGMVLERKLGEHEAKLHVQKSRSTGVGTVDLNFTSAMVSFSDKRAEREAEREVEEARMFDDDEEGEGWLH